MTQKNSSPSLHLRCFQQLARLEHYNYLDLKIHDYYRRSASGTVLKKKSYIEGHSKQLMAT